MQLTLLPEEQELARLKVEQADLEEQVVSAELALETIRAETTEFQQRYYKAVGHLYAKLDDIKAEIARMRAARNPKDTVLRKRAHCAQEQAKRSSEEAGLIEEQPKSPPVISLELKQAYRKAVKLIHPDLAISEPERQRRTKLAAYASASGDTIGCGGVPGDAVEQNANVNRLWVTRRDRLSAFPDRVPAALCG